MPRQKKPKPSFEVARDEIPETRVGWVYRSAAPEPPVVEVMPEGTPLPDFTAPRREPQASNEWIEVGLGVMVLPLTLTIALMSPVLWLFAPRVRR
jgi:hypothetical protein